MQAQATWDPDLGYWVTSSDSGHSGWFSGSFPRSGMTQGGKLYPLPKLDSPIDGIESLSSPILPTPRARDWKGKTRPGFSEPNLPNTIDRLLPTPEAKLARSGVDLSRASRDGSGGDDLTTVAAKATAGMGLSWDDFEAAIKRAEQVNGPAPEPVEPNRNGKPRITGRFVEWLMGLPAGWVTDTPKLTRKAELTMLGNGVVPQQAKLALSRLTQGVL